MSTAGMFGMDRGMSATHDDLIRACIKIGGIYMSPPRLTIRIAQHLDDVGIALGDLTVAALAELVETMLDGFVPPDSELIGVAGGSRHATVIRITSAYKPAFMASQVEKSIARFGVPIEKIELLEEVML